MNIGRIFGFLGTAFARIGRAIMRVVNSDQLEQAIDIVKDAGVTFVENAQRREWAVAQIMTRFGVPERIARWLVETAVIELHELADAAAEKAKGTLPEPAPSPTP